MISSPLEGPARTPMLGAIADDVTGATDLAMNLTEGGMRVVLTLGIPERRTLLAIEADAVVIALKSRSVPADDAVRWSLEALHVLQAAGARRFYFKYCSTFDSTDAGNIGPVAEALLDALQASHTVFCPSFPANGRTVENGRLFVHGQPLNESGMERHPLNPMTDADLVRVLSRQVNRRKVGRLPLSHLTSPDGLPGDYLRRQNMAGQSLFIADATENNHLQRLADEVVDLPLLTGSSGIARFLPAAYRRTGLLTSLPADESMPSVTRPQPHTGRQLFIGDQPPDSTHGRPISGCHTLRDRRCRMPGQGIFPTTDVDQRTTGRRSLPHSFGRSR